MILSTCCYVKKNAGLSSDSRFWQGYCPFRRVDRVAARGMSVQGPWLCENAKTLNPDRRTCSSKTVLVAQRASGFNFEIELKNIILRRVSIFEFLHSQGQKLTWALSFRMSAFTP